MVLKNRRIVIFTDGACSGNPGPGGWGSIVSDSEGMTYELGGGEASTTNNRMEIFAAVAALKIVSELDVSLYSEIQIHADSKYVIDGITKWVSGWKRRGWTTADGGEPVKNRELWESLDGVHSRIKAQTKVLWDYVRAHAGIPANERCDEIAVAYSKGESPELYRGPSSGYKISLNVPEPDLSPKQDPYYLSLVGGRVFRDATWPACQARVQGARGAKYKKCRSVREEADLLKLWGFKEK